MEHRLRSPSRTYSDMPETRKVESQFRPQLQQSPAPTISLAETERQRYLLAKNKGVFVPSAQIPASLFRQLESPASGNEEEIDVPDVDLSVIENPAPSTSRDVACQKEVVHQQVQSYNPYDAPRASTSSGFSRNDANVGTDNTLIRNDEDVEVIVVEDSDSDSHSSAESTNQGFFRGSRLPYAPAEDEEIINFVFSGNNIEKTSSILLWKELESKKESPKRTYQSLKNRFLRNIKPFILTKYRHLLTPEIIHMLKKKYPDMKVIDPPGPASKKCSTSKMNERRVVCVNPCMDNMPTTFYADRHFGVINLTANRAQPERNVLDKSDSSSASSGSLEQQNKETRDAAVGSEEVMQMDDVHQMWMEPGPSTSQLERSVNIFAREKLLDVPVQTFKYYENMKAFSNKAAVNLKLTLDREGFQVLPSDLPISISVTVTIGKEENLDSTAAPQNPSSKDGDNSKSNNNKDKTKKSEKKKGSKKGSKKGYVLKVKEKYTKKLQNECKWFARAADSLLYKAQIDRAMHSLKNDIADSSSENPSDTEPHAQGNSPFGRFSQNTNCSTEDESCYTQTLKKVSHIYKVEVRPTQSLIEDESQESILMNSAPTPPPIEDKGSVASDTGMKLKESFPSGHSLNE